MDAHVMYEADLTIAAACSHIAQDNNSDATKIVNIYLEERKAEGLDFKDALEGLARAGIKVSLMAAKHDPDVFASIISELVVGTVYE